MDRRHKRKRGEPRQSGHEPSSSASSSVGRGRPASWKDAKSSMTSIIKFEPTREQALAQYRTTRTQPRPIAPKETKIPKVPGSLAKVGRFSRDSTAVKDLPNPHWTDSAFAPSVSQPYPDLTHQPYYHPRGDQPYKSYRRTMFTPQVPIFPTHSAQPAQTRIIHPPPSQRPQQPASIRRSQPTHPGQRCASQPYPRGSDGVARFDGSARMRLPGWRV